LALKDTPEASRVRHVLVKLDSPVKPQHLPDEMERRDTSLFN
jgi:hypothetical protein